MAFPRKVKWCWHNSRVWIYKHGLLLLLIDTFQGMSTEELNGSPIDRPCCKVWSRNQS